MKRKAIGTFLAIVMVLGCSFSALAAYEDPNTHTIEEVTLMTTLNQNGLGGIVKTNRGTVTTNNGTVESNFVMGEVTTNNGTVVTNLLGGKVVTNANSGTVTTNNGNVNTNNGTVTTNNYIVTTNNGTIAENNDKVESNNGTVILNNSDGIVQCIGDDGSVITNNGTVETNNGTVKTNNGTVEGNYGVVEINTLAGKVTLNKAGEDIGTVTENYGEVSNAKLDTDGKTIKYTSGGGHVYAVTYGENPSDAALTVYTNKQIACDASGATYTVLTAEGANASRAGYTLANWILRTANADDLANYTATTFLGGEQITVLSPIWFEAVWEEAKQQEEKKEEATQAEAEEQKATVTGTEGSAVNGGQWNVGPGGYWTYRNNGIFKDTWGYITLANGKTGWFYFDKNGVMATGWKQVGGKWYYFCKASDGNEGMMLVNTTTPDGFKVGADGAMIQ